METPVVMKWIWEQGWLQQGLDLPSARQMAAHGGFSLRIVLDALREYERMGWLRIVPGGRIQVQKVQAKSIVMPAAIPAQEGVLQRLRDEISNGRFRSRQPLPKVAWLCSEWNVSTRTLAQAFRTLEQEGILHKVGKTWIVGPKPHGVASPVTSHRPTILIVSNRPEEWTEFHANLMEGMVRSIGEEADRCLVRLLPVLTGIENVEEVFPTGRVAIRSLIEDLGNQFIGILFTPLRVTVPDFEDWMQWLVRQGKPVVWIQDNLPQESVIASPRFVRVQYGDWIYPGRSESAVHLAMRTFKELGHSKVLFPLNREQDLSWFQVRSQALQAEAKEMAIEMVEWIALGKTEKELLQKGMKEGITAILAPNDHYAVAFWKALRQIGKKVPDDISLLSFDNLAERKPYPIDSIDFGMSLLGYRIFHWILGDIPIQLDPGKSLIGHCQWHINGSLSKPRFRATISAPNSPVHRDLKGVV